jgi:hypothetical protein
MPEGAASCCGRVPGPVQAAHLIPCHGVVRQGLRFDRGSISYIIETLGPSPSCAVQWHPGPLPMQ